MSLPFTFDENVLDNVSSIKEEDIGALLESYVSSDKISNARLLYGLIRNDRLESLPANVVDHIIKSALDEKQKPRLREISFLLLEHLAVDSSSLLKDSTKLNSLQDTLPYLLTQKPNIGYGKRIIDELETAIDRPYVNLATKSKILAFFSRVAALNPHYLPLGTIQSLTQFMLQWLHGNQSSEAFAKTTYTELDGTPTRDLFTVLNQSPTVTNEHILHHQIFSMLRLWLHNSHKLKTIKSDLTKRKENVPLPMGAISKFIEYSSRIIEQFDRTPTRPHDVNLQKDCLLEALSILNMMCLFDAAHIPVIHQLVRSTFDKQCDPDKLDIPPSSVPIILQCLQHFLYHGDVVGYDTQAALHAFFQGMNDTIIMDSIASYQIISFILDNLEEMCYESKILEMLFPSLVKLIAWHPQAFVEEFKDLIPAFMTSNTALEVFHTILDLPCITSALTLQSYGSMKSTAELPSELAQLLDTSASRTYKPMFDFMLRSTSGIGDTFTKIGDFHLILKPLVSYPRVVAASDTACKLIKVYFETMFAFLNEDLSTRLIPAVLERSVLLLPVANYSGKVQILMEKMLLDIIKQYPSLMTSHHGDFLEYISTVRYFNMSQSVYTHVAWMIGEFMSTVYVESCSAELITSSYETLECALYEIIASSRFQVDSFKVICMLAMAITKLASRCQDLVPRVLLCLTKVLKDSCCNEDDFQSHKSILNNRLNELIAILKMPNLTFAILSPPKEIEDGMWHRDNCSSTALVKTMNTVLSTK